MISNPLTRDGYGIEQLGFVHRTCLYIATKLGDLLDEIVVVGGLVPYLLVDQENLPSGLEPHVGTGAGALEDGEDGGGLYAGGEGRARGKVELIVAEAIKCRYCDESFGRDPSSS
ncbi:MAG: hypothetical protein OXG25_01195 [Gammaproteobacteria bacterium]|nr:hypothetical protein [Gammaproteobacteria bacterium]